MVQVTTEIKAPPIQVPEIVSSIPNHLESPTPPTAITVQTGQIPLQKKGKDNKIGR